jgi:hypothetical protein
VRPQSAESLAKYLKKGAHPVIYDT